MFMYKKRLKELREEKEVKQKELANLLGIKENTYSEYEIEYKIIPIKHLNTLCNYFNVSIDYIFDLTNFRSYPNCNNKINKNLMKIRLKELRKKHQLTQVKLANTINVAPSTISDYEREENVIATPFLYDICKKYHISADYLLGKIN